MIGLLRGEGALAVLPIGFGNYDFHGVSLSARELNRRISVLVISPLKVLLPTNLQN